jgi:hypothetical protein
MKFRQLTGYLCLFSPKTRFTEHDSRLKKIQANFLSYFCRIVFEKNRKSKKITANIYILVNQIKTLRILGSYYPLYILPKIMKKQLKYNLILAGMAFLIFSCSHETDVTPKQLEVEIDEVIEVIVNQFLSVEILGGDENEPFSSDLGNEENPNARMSFDEPDEIGSRAMISCLRALDLDQTQMQEVRRLFIGFETCQSNVTKEYRSKIRRLISHMEEVRKGLLDQLGNGEIRQDEFRNKMEQLRKRYQLVILELRENHAEDLKPCIRGFVERLPMVLGRESWLGFRACITG